MGSIQGILGAVIDAEALSLIKGYFDKQGGVEGVVKEFENTIYAYKVRSWVSTGPNPPFDPIEVQQVLGPDKLAEMAKSAGVPVDKVKDLLAEFLPIAIDKITPEGKLPPKDKA